MTFEATALSKAEKPKTSEGNFLAEVLKEVDMQLYGAAYAKTLNGENKGKPEMTAANEEMPSCFPAAKIVNGENGYFDFGAVADEKKAVASNDFIQFMNSKAA